jgi:hypothetical protein
MTEILLRVELDELVPSFAGEPGDWADVLRRADARRPRRRRRLLVAALAAVLVAVPATVAFGEDVLDLFRGMPPTPAVEQSFLGWNSMADQLNRHAAQKGFAHRFPYVDPSQAHGVVAVQTTDGPLYLWVAPRRGGGRCWLIQFGDEQSPKGVAQGVSGCDSLGVPSSPIQPGYYWTHDHPSLRVLYGQAFGGATSVRVELAGGISTELPVVDGFFLAVFDEATEVTRVASFDADGKELAEKRFSPEAAASESAETVDSD